jgi:hypothetical protein
MIGLLCCYHAKKQPRGSGKHERGPGACHFELDDPPCHSRPFKAPNVPLKAAFETNT